MPANVVKIYRRQLSSNATNLLPGPNTVATYNTAALFNNTKVATVEAHASVFDLTNFYASSGWIHYVAPINTGIAFGGGTFAGTPNRPNLPGAAVPPADDGVLTLPGGFGEAYVYSLVYDPLLSRIVLQVFYSGVNPSHPASWMLNIKLTCF